MNKFEHLSAENAEHRLAQQTCEELPCEHAHSAHDEVRECGILTRPMTIREEVEELLAGV